MQIDKDKNEKDKIVVGETKFDIFDAVLDGGLAVSFVSQADVKTCAVLKFSGLEYTVMKTDQELECKDGIAVVIDTDGGNRWAYKEDANSGP